MKGYMRRPDYYERFRCTAGACSDNCCIGWEIDIDAETAEQYRAVGGSFGERLRAGIVWDDAGSGSSEAGAQEALPHFRLAEKGRCPFLNAQNLCDIILELGEDSLCQICTDHPRFYNWFTDGCEAGVGLCCEAAAQLILAKQECFQLVCEETEQADDASSDESAEESEVREMQQLEQLLFAAREQLFALIQPAREQDFAPCESSCSASSFEFDKEHRYDSTRGESEQYIDAEAVQNAERVCQRNCEEQGVLTVESIDAIMEQLYQAAFVLQAQWDALMFPEEPEIESQVTEIRSTKPVSQIPEQEELCGDSIQAEGETEDAAQAIQPADSTDACGEAVYSTDRWETQFWQESFLQGLLDCCLSLEIMEPDWAQLLKEMKHELPSLLAERKAFLCTYAAKQYEYAQLLCYFLYRYFMDARYDDALADKILFALAGVSFIQLLDIHVWRKKQVNIQPEGDRGRSGAKAAPLLTEAEQIRLCCLYSKEIEYAEENREAFTAYVVEASLCLGNTLL